MKTYNYVVYMNDCAVMRGEASRKEDACRETHKAILDLGQYCSDDELGTIYGTVYESEPKLVMEIDHHDAYRAKEQEIMAELPTILYNEPADNIKNLYEEETTIVDDDTETGCKITRWKRVDGGERIELGNGIFMQEILPDICEHINVVKNFAGGDEFHVCTDCKSEVKHV